MMDFLLLDLQSLATVASDLWGRAMYSLLPVTFPFLTDSEAGACQSLTIAQSSQQTEPLGIRCQRKKKKPALLRSERCIAFLHNHTLVID